MQNDGADAPAAGAGASALPPSNVSDEALATLIALTGGDESTARGLLEVRRGREKKIGEREEEEEEKRKENTRGAKKKERC